LALERLQTVYQTCWDYAQQSTDESLQNWVRSLQNSPRPPQWTLTHQILTQNLYGVDLLPEAVTVTQLQLWLRLLSTVEAPADLPLLPDLSFNITRGNALLGFIRVDAESFDQIAPRRLPKQAPRAPATETVLQGNLLQPLAAASYRDTLTEKKIRVEHYQAQTKAMGSEGGIPEYAQTEFLRDRIEAVNQSVQQKLDTLLFETFSRKLGIQIKEPQGARRTRKRLLTFEDIAALQPFHWGFFFNTVVEQQGGFDVILTQVPDGNLSPKADEFYSQHQALFQNLGVEPARFRRARRQILQQFPEVARLWSLYVGQVNALKDYVRRGDDYRLPIPLTARSSISLKSLFAQRCTALAKADSVPPYIA
jgi:adenosyl cobinamide kinase/adenosyl cobinamide phosphate guanylyltransferase